MHWTAVILYHLLSIILDIFLIAVSFACCIVTDRALMAEKFQQVKKPN